MKKFTQEDVIAKIENLILNDELTIRRNSILVPIPSYLDLRDELLLYITFNVEKHAIKSVQGSGYRATAKSTKDKTILRKILDEKLPLSSNGYCRIGELDKLPNESNNYPIKPSLMYLFESYVNVRRVEDFSTLKYRILHFFKYLPQLKTLHNDFTKLEKSDIREMMSYCCEDCDGPIESSYQYFYERGVKSISERLSRIILEDPKPKEKTHKGAPVAANQLALRKHLLANKEQVAADLENMREMSKGDDIFKYMENTKHLVLRVGQMIIKKSFTIFNTDQSPVLTIKKIKPWSEGQYMINGTYVILQKNVEVVNQAEADQIVEIWKSSQQLSELLKDDFNGSCVREDNGEKKQTYSIKQFPHVLFSWKMKRPNEGFEAYTCAHCNEIHIGKTSHLK
jgi:hypothetical protein